MAADRGAKSEDGAGLVLIEAVVLPVIERVLGDYISSVLARRSSEKTRADVVATIRGELAGVAELRDEIKAMAVTMRELDLIVKRDPMLDWRQSDDALVMRQPRRWLGRGSITLEDAIDELRQNVADRRRELRLSESLAGDGKASTVLPNSFDPDSGISSPTASTESDLIPPPDGQVATAPTPSWRDRVVGLRSETAQERRRRAQDQ